MPHPTNEETRYSIVAKLFCLLAVDAAFTLSLHDPAGPLGPRGILGARAAPLLLLTTLLSLAASALTLARRDTRPARLAGQALLAAFGLLFLVRLPHDPAVGIPAVAGNLLALPLLQVRRSFVRYPHPLGRALFWTNLTASLLCLVLVGYRVLQTPAGFAAALLFVVPALLLSLVYEYLVFGASLRRGPYLEWIAAAAMAAALFRHGPLSESFLLAAGLRQAIVLARTLARTDLGATIARALYDRPAHLFILSFAGLILAGTVLLTFNAASTAPGGIRLVDALFTATSAVCVTGLVTLDTPTAFTFAGQCAILLLIQLGGLGVMTLSTFATLLVTGRLELHESTALEAMVGADRPGALYPLLRFIVLSTLAFEGAVALLLFLFADPASGLARRAWESLFHAVSAFCNAGFSVRSDNLVGYAGNIPYLLVVSFAIIAGGIGFTVLAAAWDGLRGRGVRLPLHAKVACAMSALLLVGGTLAYAVLEWGNTLAGMSPLQKAANAWFQAVTPRTAGFNSVPFDALLPPTVLLMIALMFIGASPGSTGGGIKTTTAAVILLAVRAVMRGRGDVEAAGRAIPHATVMRAAALVSLSLAAVTLVAGLLLATQNDRFDRLLFEAFSAFGTVGLSTGATARLDDLGKLLVVFLMFLGRVGPLTLALMLGGGEGAKVRLPREDLVIG